MLDPYHFQFFTGAVLQKDLFIPTLKTLGFIKIFFEELELKHTGS